MDTGEFLLLPISLGIREISNRSIFLSMRKCYGIVNGPLIGYVKVASNSSSVRSNPLAQDDKLSINLATTYLQKLATLFDKRTFKYGETFVYL